MDNNQVSTQKFADQLIFRVQSRINNVTRTKTKSLIVRITITCGLFLLPVSSATKLFGFLGGVILISGEKIFTKIGGSKLKKLSQKVNKTVIRTFMTYVLVAQIITPLQIRVSSSVNNEMPCIAYSYNGMRLASVPNSNRFPAFWKKWPETERMDRCAKIALGTFISVKGLAELSEIGLDFQNPEIYPILLKVGSGAGIVIDSCNENKHFAVLSSVAGGGLVWHAFSKASNEADFITENYRRAQQQELDSKIHVFIKTLESSGETLKTFFQDFEDAAREDAARATLQAARNKIPINPVAKELEDYIQQLFKIKPNNRNFSMNLYDLLDDLDDE